ncbi:hypothetical protein V8E51_006200 [Hyaloscypha variabilis]
MDSVKGSNRSTSRASSASDEEIRRRRRRAAKKKEKRQDIRYIVRDGPRMTSSWENPMIEAPSQTNVKSKGSIFDVYIDIKFGGKEYVVGNYDNGNLDYSDESSHSEIEKEAEEQDARSKSGDEGVRSSSEVEGEGSKDGDGTVRSTPDLRDRKAGSSDKSVHSNSETESEGRKKKTGEVNNESAKIIPGGEDTKVEDPEKVSPKDPDIKPLERRKSTKSWARPYPSGPPRPRHSMPRPYARRLPSPDEYFPHPAEIRGMNIYSLHLLKAIRSFGAYYPAQLLTGKIMFVESPFKMLFHYYHDLRRLLEEGKAEEAARLESDADREVDIDELKERNHHLSVLLDYLRPRHLNLIKPAEDRFREGVSSYEMLWLLYRPGCDVYGKVGGMLTAFVLASAKEDTRRFTSPVNGDERWEHFWTVKVWHLCYTNGKFARTSRSFKISKYEGEQDVTTLAVFPSQYLDRVDGGKTRRMLETRGSIYHGYLRAAPVHMKYKGPAWDHRVYLRVWKKEPKLQYDGEIIIDPGAFEKYASESPATSGARDRESIRVRSAYSGTSSSTDIGDDEPNRFETESQWANYENIVPKARESLTTHQYFLIERRVDGFALKQKRWMGFDIDGIEPLTWSPDENNAMSQLILPRRDIEIIKALSSRHMAGNTKQWGADFIPGKGEGQVFLLHGPPGTGKTYTVECVADYTRRPLVYLTVADIGTDEVLMETNLSRWFTVAASWQAVILIDEADVFLERRQGANLQRNSLVSVFLRCMEYYPGMLFLTTNRIGQIDDAFLSRTSVALTYEPLNPSVQVQIWDGFLSKLQRERRDMIVTDRARTFLEEDKDMKSIPWNGREIRNALQTAIALAIYDSEQESKMTGKKPAKIEVDKEHFSKVVQRRKTFIEYRDSIRRQTEEQRALGEGSRALPKR